MSSSSIYAQACSFIYLNLELTCLCKYIIKQEIRQWEFGICLQIKSKGLGVYTACRELDYFHVEISKTIQPHDACERDVSFDLKTLQQNLQILAY